MKWKSILLLVFGLLLLYPLFSLFQLNQGVTEPTELEVAQVRLIQYQISLWISWAVMATISVFFKWTKKRNLFFTLTYGFLFHGFMVYGIYAQHIVNLFGLPSRFEDNYTFGIFTAVQHILISAILTGFLQTGVWWFYQRWHR